MWLGLVLLAALVLPLAYLFGTQRSAAPTPTPSPNGSTVTVPAGVKPGPAAGWSIGPDTPGKKTLVIWEDPQCPICGQVEKGLGEIITALHGSGRVNVEYRMVSFLDSRFPGSKNASHRAVNALGCALDISGQTASDYHRALYASQPAQEGAGWTDEQLIALLPTTVTAAQKATFASCVRTAPYLGWSDRTTQEFIDAKLPGTPYFALDGAYLDLSPVAKMTTAQQVLDYLATGVVPASLPSPSPGPSK